MALVSRCNNQKFLEKLLNQLGLHIIIEFYNLMYLKVFAVFIQNMFGCC